MKNKAEYTIRTLDDKIMKDGLEAVSTLDTFGQTRGSYLVVGGVAAQSYLPTSCRRATSDIDLVVAKPLARKREFLDYAKPTLEWLQDNNFSVETNEKRRTWNITTTSPEDETILIEFTRSNQKYFDRISCMLKRELQHARSKLVEERNIRYKVVAPEDIVVPKFSRIC